MSSRPRIVVIGTTDVDARLELIHSIAGEFDIHVLGSSGALREKFARAGVRYSTYGLTRRANPVLDFLSLLQLWVILRRLRPALVHAFDTKPSVLGRIAARLAGVPVVIGTLPGLGSLYSQDNLVNRLLKRVYRLLQTIACRMSDLTIFQNEDDARQLVAEGVTSADRTMVIPGSGVATQRFSQEQIPGAAREAIRAELGIGKAEIVITMVSRIIRSKGVLDFMAAASGISYSFPQVRFLLIGPEDPESLDRLTAAEVHQLKQVVSWPGARDDVPSVLAISDAFVLPSTYREGIPRVLLEALSMGLPIVTTDSPGCREAVREGRNGFLVAAGDPTQLETAILRLVEDREMRRSFGLYSRQLALENFDLAVIAAQVRSLYHRLLDLDHHLLAA